jgi:hypothetical protein
MEQQSQKNMNEAGKPSQPKPQQQKYQPDVRVDKDTAVKTQTPWNKDAANTQSSADNKNNPDGRSNTNTNTPPQKNDQNNQSQTDRSNASNTDTQKKTGTQR